MERLRPWCRLGCCVSCEYDEWFPRQNMTAQHHDGCATVARKLGTAGHGPGALSSDERRDGEEVEPGKTQFMGREPDRPPRRCRIR